MNKKDYIKILKNLNKCLKIIPEYSEWYNILLNTQAEILKESQLEEI